MDDYILYKAYKRYLRDPEPSDHFESSNKHEINIRSFQLRMYETKEEFMGCYGTLIHRMFPKLQRMRRMVLVPELGGNIEMKEEGYDELWEEIVKLYERCERLYKYICEYEDCIANEYAMIEKEKSDAMLQKWRHKRWLKAPIDAPMSGVQLELFG